MTDRDRERRQAATAEAVNGLINMAALRRRQPWLGASRHSPATVSFAALRQMVRRHRPSELLPALAALAAAGDVDDPTRTPWANSAPPWAVALIARESILWGNELRDAPVTAEALRKVFNAFNSLRSIAAEDLRAARLQGQSLPDESATLAILVTHAYEQFPYQESQFEEVSRSHAMLLDGLNRPGLEVMSAEAWTDLLGSPLGEVFGATFFLHVAAHSNNGWFDHAWLDRDDIAEMFEQWPREAIIERAQNLTLTREEFKATYQALPNPGAGRERYAPNPLTSHPFVPMPDGRLLAPQPALILRTITPGALFYPAKEHLGDGFARDMGHVVEAYVGRQLASIEPKARIHSEVTYDKSERKSVDWFLDLDALLIMIEVKSARFGLLERAGTPGFTARSAKTDRPCRRAAATDLEGTRRTKPRVFAHSPWPPTDRVGRHCGAALRGQLAVDARPSAPCALPDSRRFIARDRVARDAPPLRNRAAAGRHCQRPRALNLVT